MARQVLESRDSGIGSGFCGDSVIRHVIMISKGGIRYNACFPCKLIPPSFNQIINLKLRSINGNEYDFCVDGVSMQFVCNS